jgi:type IV secretory pathway VirB2 component (pilin)
MNLSRTLGDFVNKGRTTIAADKARKVDVDRRAAKTMMLMALCLAAVLPGLAVAGPWDTMGTQVLAIFTGGLTRTIAIITVIACGIAAMAGKLSWDWAIKIIVGIVLIFGAAAIVDYLIAAAS